VPDGGCQTCYMLPLTALNAMKIPLAPTFDFPRFVSKLLAHKGSQFVAAADERPEPSALEGSNGVADLTRATRWTGSASSLVTSGRASAWEGC
jgi:hypothetical protein